MTQSNGLFAGLDFRRYQLIAADVPWNYKTRSDRGMGRSAEQHYRTMAPTEIARLPVEAYSARDCHLLFWITGPFLAVGAHVPIMRAWGFEPTAIWGVWVKPNRKQAMHFENGRFFFGDALWKMGMGHTTRQNAEFVVLGRKGKPKRLSRAVHQIITAPLREHSRKPDEFFVNAEAYAEGPYLELFGREERPGWDVRGDEVGKFKEGNSGKETRMATALDRA